MSETFSFLVKWFNFKNGQDATVGSIDIMKNYLQYFYTLNCHAFITVGATYPYTLTIPSKPFQVVTIEPTSQTEVPKSAYSNLPHFLSVGTLLSTQAPFVWDKLSIPITSQQKINSCTSIVSTDQNKVLTVVNINNLYVAFGNIGGLSEQETVKYGIELLNNLYLYTSSQPALVYIFADNKPIIINQIVSQTNYKFNVSPYPGFADYIETSNGSLLLQRANYVLTSGVDIDIIPISTVSGFSNDIQDMPPMIIRCKNINVKSNSNSMANIIDIYNRLGQTNGPITNYYNLPSERQKFATEEEVESLRQLLRENHFID